MPTPQTERPSNHQPDAEAWLLAKLPHTSFFGESFAYLDTGSGHSTQFYSVDWLTEEFGSIIETVDHPKHQLISAAREYEAGGLRRFFGQIDE